MQLNVYVPRARAELLRALDEVARRRARPKNEIVLDAIEEYLRRMTEEPGTKGEPSKLKTFNLGVIEPFRREDLYAEWLDL